MNFRTLDLNLLRVFDMVMAEGSLTRAANALALTQPAASHALKRLTAALGEPLFTRSAFGMKPTAKAEAMWPQVRLALSGLQQVLAPEQFDPAVDTATFRIAMADATAAMLAPTMLRSLERQSSKTNLHVLPLVTRDPRKMLQQGEVDLAIGHFPEAIAALASEGSQAGLRHQRLNESRYVAVMRREHPLAEVPLSLDIYCEANHLLVSFSGRPHGLVDQALAALGRKRRVVLTVNQFFTAGQVVTQSDLLTVLPLSFIPATGTQGRVVTRTLPFELGPVAIEMLWQVRQDTDPAHRWLRQEVQRAAGIAATVVTI